MASLTPQLTFDLMGVANMVLNAGSRGFKQLATCGVHEHTLGCMFMIAELAPASTKYRQYLNEVRKQQRSERFIYFKAVEIGAASNFLVDHMLNTRAGENVLALLSAIAPLLDETSCAAILSLLFETAGVAIDSTPSLRELEKFRSAVLPFVRATDFKDKVLLNHYLLRALEESTSLDDSDPYKAIPHENDAPKIIQMLFKVASNPNYTLSFHGITGAAWVATYASEILGLVTCAINGSGYTYPISGKFDEARVILRVSSTTPAARCELSIAGTVEGFISLDRLISSARSGWSVDCSRLNFLDANHPKLRDMSEYNALCEFVAVETFNKISDIARETARSVGYDDKRSFGSHILVPYAMSVLPDLCTAALSILQILGFQCPPISRYLFERGLDPVRQYCVGCLSAPRLIASESLHPALQGTRFAQFTFVHELSKSDGNFHFTWENLTSERTTKMMRYIATRVPAMTVEKEALSDAWSEHAQMQLSRTLGNAVDIAANLAFTDWATHARILSVRRFYRGEEPFWSEIDREYYACQSLTGSFRIVPIVTDSFHPRALARKIARLDWAGVDLDGLIVLQSALTHRSLESIRGCSLQLRLGRIIYEGASADSIQIDTGDGKPVEYFVFDIRSPLKSNAGRVMEPVGSKASSSSISGIGPEFRQTCTLKSNAVWLRVECRYAAGRWLHVNPLKIPERLTASWVTRPCSHGTDSSFFVHRSADDDVPQTAHTKKSFSNSAGFMYNTDPEPRMLNAGNSTVIFPQFERGLENAWLTYLPCFHWNKGSVTDYNIMDLLQKDTCLLCAVHQINQLWRRFDSYDSKIIIVPWCDRSDSPEGQEQIPADFQTCQNFNAVQCFRSGFPRIHSVSVRFDPCPASFHTPCCARRLEILEENRLATAQTECTQNDELLYRPCVACVPRLCRLKTPCEGCRKLYEAQNVEHDTMEAEGEQDDYIH